MPAMSIVRNVALFGRADRRAGDRVDLFDRVFAGRQRAEDLHDAEQAEVVGDEVRRVLRDDHALAEPSIGKCDDGVDDGRVGVGDAE